MAKQERVVHDFYVGPNGNRFQPAATVDVEHVEKKVKRGEWRKATSADLKKVTSSTESK